MDYLKLDKDIFYSIINMKLRDDYKDLNDLCLSENIDKNLFINKINKFGFKYDRDHNRLIEI